MQNRENESNEDYSQYLDPEINEQKLKLEILKGPGSSYGLVDSNILKKVIFKTVEEELKSIDVTNMYSNYIILAGLLFNILCMIFIYRKQISGFFKKINSFMSS